MRKINFKKILVICYLLFVICLLVYTRFVGINWGLPYMIHPDERNMANAVQQLSCQFSVFNFQFSKLFSNFYQQLSTCYNPHFFAYGQFPLYLAYSGIQMYHAIFKLPNIITFEDATMALRIISAVASILTVITVIKIIKIIIDKRLSTIYYLLSTLLLIFSPYAIQLSHFGTTESLLMLFYSLIVYLSIKVTLKQCNNRTIVLLSVVSGLALATKVSSTLFLVVPIIAILSSRQIKKFVLKIILLVGFVGLVVLVFIIFSPHNFISFPDFLGSMGYESDVALGRYVAFYTRQFDMTAPIWFQLTKIFPNALGWPQYILAILGFFFLPWKDRRINILRFAFLIYFLPNAFFFAKWTRFMAPVFPIMSVFALLFLYKILNFKFQAPNKLKISNLLFFVICILLFIISILPGIAYLSIYQQPDIHFTVSDWIYKNIPNNAYILSETANVIDLPVQGSNVTMKQLNNYRYISFNFYDLDIDPNLQTELQQHVFNADYIFVPSRRIFANHSCLNPTSSARVSSLNERCKVLQKTYPLLNSYYDKLFSGKLGFEKVAEFTSYPKICVPLLNAICYMLRDEDAEESWTIFDHPVFRIYRKISNPKFK